MQSPGAGDGGKHVHPLPYGDVNQSRKSRSHVFSDVALMDLFFFFGYQLCLYAYCCFLKMCILQLISGLQIRQESSVHRDLVMLLGKRGLMDGRRSKRRMWHLQWALVVIALRTAGEPWISMLALMWIWMTPYCKFYLDRMVLNAEILGLQVQTNLPVLSSILQTQKRKGHWTGSVVDWYWTDPGHDWWLSCLLGMNLIIKYWSSCHLLHGFGSNDKNTGTYSKKREARVPIKTL